MVGSYALTFPKHMEYFPLWHGATSADGTVAIRHQDEGRPKGVSGGQSRLVGLAAPATLCMGAAEG